MRRLLCALCVVAAVAVDIEALLEESASTREELSSTATVRLSESEAAVFMDEFQNVAHSIKTPKLRSNVLLAERMATKVLSKTSNKEKGGLDLIFHKLEQLETEIKDEQAEALDLISQKRKTAQNEIDAETATIENAMKIRTENTNANKASQARIVECRTSWMNSRSREAGIHESLVKLQADRQTASETVKGEIDERNKAIDILTKALFLVCMRFHSFKNTVMCMKIKSQPDVDEPERYETKEPAEAEEETKMTHKADTPFTLAWEEQEIKDRKLEGAPCPDDPTTCPVLDAMRGDLHIQNGKTFAESDSISFFKELSVRDSDYCAGACNDAMNCKAFLFVKDGAKCKLTDGTPDEITDDVGFVTGVKPEQEGTVGAEQLGDSEQSEDEIDSSLEDELNDSDFELLQLNEGLTHQALSYGEQQALGELQRLARESSWLSEKYATPIKELVLSTSASVSKKKGGNVVTIIVEVMDETRLEQAVAKAHHQDKLDAWYKESWAKKRALDDEHNEQSNRWSTWQQERSHIEERIVASEVQRRAQEAAEDARKMIEDRIREDERVYGIEDSLRLEDLENLVKLRSLLRALYDATKPTGCPLTNGVICTNKEAGWVPSKAQRCSCNRGYYGVACELKMCPGLGDVLYEHDADGVCSERGIGQTGGKGCDNRSGQCHCAPGYYSGPANKCEYRHAPPSKYESEGESYLMGDGVVDDQCSGRGTVDKIRGICTCKEAFWGVPPNGIQINGACETRKCPNTNGIDYPYVSGNACNGHGACIPESGECSCQDPYFGHACENTHCPNDCSGNGHCDITTGKCACNQEPMKYSGPSCEFMDCHENCNLPNGECNRNDGKCICKIGFSVDNSPLGDTCQLDSRCTANTLNTPETNWWTVWDKPGWITCPDGQLLYSVRRSSCEALSCIDSGSCAAACEGESHVYQVRHCYHDLGWYNSMDQPGWSKCLPDYFVAGLYRSCESLYCLNMAKCCSLVDARWALCGQAVWGSSFGNAGWSRLGEAGKHAFITGLKRGKAHTISAIHSASWCGFVRGF